MAQVAVAIAFIHREPLYSSDSGRLRLPLLQKRSLRTEVHAILMSHPLPEEAEHTPPSQTNLSAWTSVRQERWEGELAVDGNIPHWLSGTYLRNGPGIWHVGDHEFVHLFDGFGMLVRLHFDNGRLTAGHRQIESEAFKAAKKSSRLCYREFSTAPKLNSLLAYLRHFAGLLSGRFITDNASVAVFCLGDGRILCLTETVNGSVLVDPDTLQTLGRFEFSDGIWGMLQSVHPLVTEKELLTVIPDLLWNGYIVVKMEAGTNERKVLGRIKCRGGPTPGWMHAFPVTENYVVVPEMLLRYSIPNLLQGVAAPLEWYPDSGNYMHVMCRRSGKIVTSVEVPPFLTSHFINGNEEVDEEGRVVALTVDCCEYNSDPTIILETLKLHNLRSFTGQDVLPDSRVGRFRIPLDGSPIGSLESVLDPEQHGRALDLCTINHAYHGRPYRYAYGCGARRPCNVLNTLTKLDMTEKKAKVWYEDGAVPSEPLFVARPGATEEDDGVVISIVNSKNGEGYAIILDGSSFEEIARGKLPYGLPYGFHGCWVPEKFVAEIGV